MNGEDPTPHFGYRTQVDDEVSATVTVTGELDVVTGPRLEAALIDMARLGIRRFTLDAAAMSFIDSTGLRVLVELTKFRDGVEITVRGASPRLRTLLEITGLDALIFLE